MIPQMYIATVQTSLSVQVTGMTSPYPMDVIVITAQYREVVYRFQGVSGGLKSMEAAQVVAHKVSLVPCMLATIAQPQAVQ
mmetsp:Transcript_6889/g.16935  ORF Transcript_6889/g.16935 Transcript_6889/m.16935 type:complete len:81 (-) Transcript_6889:4-246(-)